MPKIAILFGILLIGLGAAGYFGSDPVATTTPPNTSNNDTADANETATENLETPAAAPKPAKKSLTALIPAGVGLLMGLFGMMALKESMLKHAMHGAATVGLLGALMGIGRGAMGVGKFFSGDPSLNQRSFAFVWIM
ncbi:MAG: hypothetical protein AAFP69_16740, partial [Planctomycetota bacterium]